jgi:4-hydroxybenzoate polyprenyltransferase
MLPGVALSLAFQIDDIHQKVNADLLLIMFTSLLSLCLISSANYVINEYLDRNSDLKHPMKKHRIATHHDFSLKSIVVLYLLITFFAGITSIQLPSTIKFYLVTLLIMGILYNIKPVRLKDRHYVDVLSESINNPIRLAIGWHCVTPQTAVPASAFISYWGLGIFLMSLKRYTEMELINNRELLANYRESFKMWTPNKLLIFSFVGALVSAAFSGILLVKYRLEYILMYPAFIWIFAEYLSISLKLDEASYAPEKLMRKKRLQAISLIIAILFLVLSFVSFPILYQLIYG